MAHWPGHERPQTTDRSKGKHKECLDANFWQWPHLDYGSIGRATLVSKDGRLQWSTVVGTSHKPRWIPLGKPVKVFPETRSPQVTTDDYSARQRARNGLQYLRAYFPDADFPGELLGNALEADAKEMRGLKAFDPFLGNNLEIIPSHQVQNEYLIVFPMGELCRELNISPFSSDGSGNMVFNPTGSPSFVFETPILQITSAIWPAQWTPTSSSLLLVRTHTSSSLLCFESSKVTRQFDITRADTGDVPIADCRILSSGSHIVVVNRSGMVYKCNTYRGGKAMQLIRGHEANDDDDPFWQLGVTGRSDECFLASSKAVKHIDLRSASSATDIFSLDDSTTIVTSVESPLHDSISRITTTSDVIWLDDRFRRRPLLSFKHHRSFDRTLRVLSANLCGASISLLTSRRNGLVTLYDVDRGTDRLLHCNSNPFCLPHPGPMATGYDGHALLAFPSDVQLTFLRLCQRGSVHRQDIRAVQGDQPESVQEDHPTHQWNEGVLTLEKQASGLHIDFGPAGEKHITEVNLRGAYEKIFAIAEDTQEDTFSDTLARLPDVWQDIEDTTDNMLTAFDVISGIDGDKHSSRTNFLASGNIGSKQVFDALMRDHSAISKLAGLARWHYNLQDTSIPAFDYCSDACATLHEKLKELNLVSEVDRRAEEVRRETKAREQLVVDLALSRDVFSARPLAQLRFAANEETPNAAPRHAEMTYREEPPEIKFGYFRPIRKAGADHYAGKDQDRGQEPGIPSPLGVRLLLAEWELGTDPKDYEYRDPYGVADMDVRPIPAYRKLPAGTPMTQKKQMPLQRPPLVIAAATQLAPVVQSQTVESEPAFSQEPMVSTQVLPGRFGGRPVVKKKRLGGF